jgi:DnaJ-class molecular chaperone
MIACKHCKGKGTYIVQETYGDGDTALMTYECNYCHGSGEDQDSQADAPFDLGDDNDDDD